MAGGSASFLSNPLASSVIYYSGDPDVTVAEALPAAKTGTFSDSEGNASVTLTASSGAISQNNTTSTWHWSAFAGDGPLNLPITITATDLHGGVSQAAFAFQVTNRPPSGSIAASTVVATGAPAGFTLTATDPAIPDQLAGFAWSINYGDGTATETAAAGTASPLARSHVYANPGFYTVTAQATDKDGGTGTLTSSTIEVLGGIHAWRLIHFGSTSASGNAALLFDADGDGLVNLTEFAFGLNPRSGASSQLPAASLVGGNLVVTFPEPPGVAGSVIYRAEWSTNLSSGNWIPLADSGTGSTHTFTVPMAGRTKVFIRLIVTGT